MFPSRRQRLLFVLAALLAGAGLQVPSAAHAANPAPFNGSSTFLDRSADLSGVANLAQGAIAVRFRSTSTAVAKSFFSASHTADDSSNLSFALNGGAG
ncbi:hypothetical protein PSN13_01854 [Micromonospora saelicesensis]|uniref:Uncharacterized protein n=1 Tax=Micromonospora saelicesensis TaxID=285676 RepID=A0A328NP29_9ACTN|nr:hypothetical protein [Micromonospora saelicesensis]RAO36258.1 hypothetical protein PSN13_01854 [Micromonospora saelicesensis]